MNHTVNIKEMMSMPAAGSRSAAANGGTNFTDSQFFFGSQFWRENSQGLSQEMSLSSRNSQQSSIEESDPKCLTSYRSKPLLFGDPKDKHKAFGLLDTFEEEKKKAKEKNDSNMLAKECLHIRETLNKIQQLIVGTEENASERETILQKLSNLSSALQNVSSIQNDISKQFEALLNTVNSHKEMMIELGERVQKNEVTSIQLGSNMQSDVEHLRKEQEKTRLNHESMLEEALQLLNTLVSEHSAKLCPGNVTDTAMQTSPGQENGIETAQDSHTSQVPAADLGIRKATSRVSRKRKKKRALVPPQRSNLTVSDENSQPLVNGSKRRNLSRPRCASSGVNQVSSRSLYQPNTKGRSTEAAGCFITPLSCWSQESNNSDILKDVKPILEKANTEPNAGAVMTPDALWRLFDMDYN
ncbi:interactor of HORMAD1 protein 1 isoform X2 [Dunckerocampus dactyliophorus]|uniref:interactor of HORMAD1 protein 1 isoform X2 n=1 Tax=Dunckerocampus dactyliophorus TaxID=161453 RepID=UPI002405048C|nr:interactor of HORMAD1 protein 1 isoform X2 [Dunckerocampus dactyliophorus]XP_054640945.1 interactor of HORMAD1 protein 1 isoform X2 [Dunckerocampus dactyliophorus]